MAKLEDLLGNQEPTAEGKQLNPLEATPQGEESIEENPLEKMDKLSKEKNKKDAKGNKKLDSETLEEMLMTGENTNGMFEPEVKEPEGNEPKLNEEVDEDAKRNFEKNKATPSEKYTKAFSNDLLKHPEDYTINTPQGEMTIAEAIRKGYNPITKRFEEAHNQDAIKEKYLNQLNEADRMGIEQITDPRAAQIAPADAGKYGLNSNSPMVRQPMPEGGIMPQGGMPMEEAPQGAPAPVGAPIPGAEESMAPGAPQGGNPLEALLGGNQ